MDSSLVTSIYGIYQMEAVNVAQDGMRENGDGTDKADCQLSPQECPRCMTDE